MAKTPQVPAKADKNELMIPDDIDVFGDAGHGNENVGQADVIIPRLKIAQSMSKQIKKNRPEYIEGLEEGDAYNTATGEVFKMPLTIVPVFYQRRYIEWVPLDNGGGLVNPDHPADIMDQVNEEGLLPNGNEVIDTPEHFCLLIDEAGERIMPVIMSMASSGQKVSRAWNTIIRDLRITNPKTGMKMRPARWYGAYTFETVDESNEKGDWKNWKVRYAGPLLEFGNIGVEAYRQAKMFYDEIQEGRVQAEVEQPGGEGEARPTTDAM